MKDYAGIVGLLYFFIPRYQSMN